MAGKNIKQLGLEPIGFSAENYKTKTTADKSYNESDRWKCSDSPTKAHHWQEHWIGRKLVWICKYCFAQKDKFDTRTAKERTRESIEGIKERNHGNKKI